MTANSDLDAAETPEDRFSSLADEQETFSSHPSQPPQNISALSEPFFQSLVAASPDGILLVDQEGCIRFASPALLRLFSLESAEDIIGTQVTEWVEPEDQQRILSHAVQALDGLLSQDNIYHFHNREGRHFVAEAKASPMLDASGRITGFMAVVRDVTDRWEAGEALAFSEARFRSVVQSNPAGMHFYHLRKDGRLVLEDANLAADRILGVDHARLLGKTIEEAFPGLVETEIPQVYRRLAADGGQWRSDQISYDRNEIRGAFEVTAFQIAPGHMVVYFTDVTERMRRERQLQLSLQNLQLLRTVDKMIIEHDDEKTSMEMVLRPVLHFFQADAAEILLYDPARREFNQVAGAGFISPLAAVPVGDNEGMPGLAMRERKVVSILHLPSVLREIGNVDFLIQEGFVSACSALLVTPNRVQGVLQLFYRAETCLSSSELEFFEMIANQVAIAVEKTSLWENHQKALMELVQAYESTLEGWVMALDLRDNELEHHTRRVTELTLATAEAMGMCGTGLTNIRRGALLHDIGKIGIPDRILHKEGALSDEEWVQMRKHPILAKNMLSPIEYLRSAIDIPYCHHERWNGSGYPRGLKGTEIPLAARIFALADVWDALTSNRPYRRAWSRADTVAYIKENTGILFDPEIVPLFLKVLGETGG